MKVELAVLCHKFEHRFCWMLSSLLDQTAGVSDLIVNAAYLKGSKCGRVLDHFQALGLNVKHTPYEDTNDFQKRGLTRNRQIQETQADWMWFADCDMVVAPTFLEKLYEVLSSRADERRMLYTGRFSTRKPSDPTDSLIDGYEYPKYIKDSWGSASNLPKVKKSNIGAGFCQIINVEALRKFHGGVYVDPRRNRDREAFKTFWKTRSDGQFRRRVGKLKVDLPYFIHLQHKRDNEVGSHIEEER